MKDEKNNEYINQLEVVLRCAKKDIEQLIRSLSFQTSLSINDLDEVKSATDTIEQINEILQ